MKNLSRLKKRKHNKIVIEIRYLISSCKHTFTILFITFTLPSVSTEKTYETLKTIFHHIFKHLEVHQEIY